MRTVSLQRMPNGFELETPSFLYWLKAGLAFSLGGAIVYIGGTLCWWFLVSRVPELIILRWFTR